MKFRNLNLINEKGFTLIELLIVVVIIGILASTGVAVYARHINSSHASESLHMLEAIISYTKSYHRAHQYWPPRKCNTHNHETDEWIDEVVGEDNVYFEYHYDRDELQIRAHGKKGGKLFDKKEEITYKLETGEWSATARLVDILP